LDHRDDLVVVREHATSEDEANPITKTRTPHDRRADRK
jgi:hypothetical protein